MAFPVCFCSLLMDRAQYAKSLLVTLSHGGGVIWWPDSNSTVGRTLKKCSENRDLRSNSRSAACRVSTVAFVHGCHSLLWGLA